MSSNYENYINQKNKYFNLQIMNRLKELYPKVQFDKNTTGKSSELTYGEMEYDGIEKLNNKYGKPNNLDVFIDIGSGRGKLCIYAACQDNINKSIGIEIVEERHQDAINLLNKLCQEFPKNTNFRNKIEFMNKDILNASNILNNYISNPPLVWVSNLCFNEDTNKKVFDQLVEIMPNNSIIGCSKEPQTNNLTLLEKMDVPMSWNPNSQIYVYKIQK
jgi:hypothetical protein